LLACHFRFAARICLSTQVTSAKQGNGVEALRDGKDDTYWQSDGAQPHLVNIQFQRKVHLSSNAAAAPAGVTGRTARRLCGLIASFHIDRDIALFDAPIQIRLSAIALLLDFKLDESYTPSKIAIRAGTTHADLKEVWMRKRQHSGLFHM
jgi:anaphase-promoting complex subunit 10